MMSFVETLYVLRIWMKRLNTKQTLFRTDTHSFLICLVRYHFFCANGVSNMIRYPHTKHKEILITKMIYPRSTINCYITTLVLT